MGHAEIMSGTALAAVLAVGLAITIEDNNRPEPVALREALRPAVAPVVELDTGSTGSALATAAFGLSALQPETFNSEVVIDIIEASPLGYSEKDRLTAKLMAAEAGNAELPEVLADIRVSLAVE